MVFSLLQMQKRHSPDDTVREPLQTTHLRVENIAALHNQLLADGALELIAFLNDLILAVINCLAN
jgi:two-component sensor histidine kinase